MTSQKTTNKEKHLSPLMDYMRTPAPLHYNEALHFGVDQQQQTKSRLPKLMVQTKFQKQAFLFHFDELYYTECCEAYFLW